jgi:cold shock CspA family protein
LAASILALVPNELIVRQVLPGADRIILITQPRSGTDVHRNSVVNNGFGKLRVGDQVGYVLSSDPGEKDAQASTVELLGPS